MSTEVYSSESRDYLSVFRARKWWIIGASVLVVGAAVINSVIQTPLYRSTAEVLVLAVSGPGPSGGDFVNIDNELQIATSGRVADAADATVSEAGLVPGDVSIDNTAFTDTLEFAAVSTDPRAAKTTAQAYADAYLKFRSDQLLSSVDASLESVDSLIGSLNAKISRVQEQLASAGSSAEIQALSARISSLTGQITQQQTLQNELFLAKNSSVGQVLQPADLPQSPFSPNHVRAAALGLFLGIFLGIGLALLRDRVDHRLRGREEIEEAVGAPVIAMIPEAASSHKQLAVVGGDPRAAEAFRSLRTKILFSASRSPLKTIMVTSPQAGEGKTTTAANIAVALAQADQRVVLVSSDLRRPGLQRYFPNLNGTGLSDVLSGTAELATAVTAGPVGNLLLVSSGSDDFQLDGGGLGSAEMRRVIGELSAAADYVVLDTTPVLGVSDAIDLASIVDTAILVMDANKSTRPSIEEAVDDLRSVGTSILGVVLNRFDPKKFHPYYHHARSHYYANAPSGDGSTIRDR